MTHEALLIELELESCQRSPYFKSAVSQQKGAEPAKSEKLAAQFADATTNARGSAQPKSGAAGRLGEK